MLLVLLVASTVEAWEVLLGVSSTCSSSVQLSEYSDGGPLVEYSDGGPLPAYSAVYSDRFDPGWL